MEEAVPQLQMIMLAAAFLALLEKIVKVCKPGDQSCELVGETKTFLRLRSFFNYTTQIKEKYWFGIKVEVV